MSDIRFDGGIDERRHESVLHSLLPNERRLRLESVDGVHYAPDVLGIDEDLGTLELQEK